MKLEDLMSPEAYAQFKAAIDKANAGQPDKTKHVRFADLSEGGYVSRDKHESTVNGLNATIDALQKQLAGRDTDVKTLQDQLNAAQTDASKLKEAQKQIESMTSKYEADRKSWEATTAKQRVEFAIRTEAEKIKFSSAAAKRDFIRGAVEKDLKMDGETLLGLTDYVTAYKQSDPGAILPDQPPAPEPPKGNQPGEGVKPPKIVLPVTKPEPDKSPFGFHFNGVRPAPKE